MEPLVEICAEVDGLLRGRKRQGNVAGMERRRRPAAEAPHQCVGVLEQACCFDATVEELPGLGQLAAHAPKAAESQDEYQEELASRPVARATASARLACLSPSAYQPA